MKLGGASFKKPYSVLREKEKLLCVKNLCGLVRPTPSHEIQKLTKNKCETVSFKASYKTNTSVHLTYISMSSCIDIVRVRIQLNIGLTF